jgi:GDP-L-fucose synthase
MVGSAILRNLQAKGFNNILTRTSAELDLRDQQAVNNFFAAEKPDYVFLAAARVGGILANNN